MKNQDSETQSAFVLLLWIVDMALLPFCGGLFVLLWVAPSFVVIDLFHITNPDAQTLLGFLLFFAPFGVVAMVAHWRRKAMARAQKNAPMA